jgi:flagellar protein FliS
MTATPEQLQLMLYDGAIRFAMQARDALSEKNYETSFDRLARAQRIILEMRCGLNYDVNRELCERVAGLYGFIYRKLVTANVERSAQAIEDALKILRMERETWQILVERLAKERENASIPTPHRAPAQRVIEEEPEPIPSLSVEG